MNTKYLLFDLADTLLEKKELIPTIKTIILSRTGIILDSFFLRRTLVELKDRFIIPDNPSYEFYNLFNQKFLEALGVEDKNESICKEIYLKSKSLQWSPFNDVRSISVFSLPKGIISNWNRNIKKDLIEVPCEFSEVFGSETIGLSKPSIEFYKLVIDKINIRPENILYIADSPTLDLEPALSLGLNAYLIDRYDLYPMIQKRIFSLSEITNLM